MKTTLQKYRRFKQLRKLDRQITELDRQLELSVCMNLVQKHKLLEKRKNVDLARRAARLRRKAK